MNWYSIIEQWGLLYIGSLAVHVCYVMPCLVLSLVVSWQSSMNDIVYCSVPRRLLVASTVFSTEDEVTWSRRARWLVLQCSSSRHTCLSTSPSVCLLSTVIVCLSVISYNTRNCHSWLKKFPKRLNCIFQLFVVKFTAIHLCVCCEVLLTLDGHHSSSM